jgi:hypothetical protein
MRFRSGGDDNVPASSVSVDRKLFGSVKGAIDRIAGRDEPMSSASFNEASITWLTAPCCRTKTRVVAQHRYMQIEGMTELTPPLIDADPAKLPPLAA